ncbi:tetratricopeptide repeat protein [Humisphaera borealis]|uniref:Tetratricopeptide repeat protein n=1 Tax=Humisphaera borealis TaxID=2807512 RepID=A0A7M2WZ30_9BACT|nr:tetratricopeptide repeat protein [Humisphaera borealis]QOV90736.1 tetratricopeptide repeat protein [Humisphaera borealis]
MSMNLSKRSGGKGQKLPYRTLLAIPLGLLAAAGCSGGGSSGAPNTRAAGASALYAKGDQAYQSGDRVAAIKDLEAAVAADPKMLMARERLGDAYKDVGRYEDAMVEYRELARLDPYGPTSYYKLGVTQQLLGRLEPAAENYQKSLKLDSREWRSRMNLGLVRLAQGKVDEAVKATKLATEAAPKEADAWSNYGVALDAGGNPADAEQAYRMALTLAANQPGTMLNLSQSLLAQKKYDQVLPVVAEVVKIEDSTMARRIYGDALKGQGKTAEADEQYKKAEALRGK